jgi:integrase
MQNMEQGFRRLPRSIDLIPFHALWLGHIIAHSVLVALYTGTRSGAVCAASLEPAEGRGHVDLDAGIFKRLPQGKRQTKKRQPTIRLPDRLLAHMRRWRDKGISRSAVIEFEGKPVASVKKAFARVAADVGLENVSPHTLRHTAVTWAMQNRADIYEAAGFFGMSPAMIEARLRPPSPRSPEGSRRCRDRENETGAAHSSHTGSRERTVIFDDRLDERSQ